MLLSMPELTFKVGIRVIEQQDLDLASIVGIDNTCSCVDEIF
jgi:hypothetical protein